MEAPNKIWLSKFEEDPGDNEYGIFEQWSLEPINCAENEEYIRKDALLEWLKGKKKYYMDRQEYDCGWNDLLEDIIDKLNSM